MLLRKGTRKNLVYNSSKLVSRFAQANLINLIVIENRLLFANGCEKYQTTEKDIEKPTY